MKKKWKKKGTSKAKTNKIKNKVTGTEKSKARKYMRLESTIFVFFFVFVIKLYRQIFGSVTYFTRSMFLFSVSDDSHHGTWTWLIAVADYYYDKKLRALISHVPMKTLLWCMTWYWCTKSLYSSYTLHETHSHSFTLLYPVFFHLQPKIRLKSQGLSFDGRPRWLPYQSKLKKLVQAFTILLDKNYNRK